MRLILLSVAALTMFSASAQVEVAPTFKAEPKGFTKYYFVCRKSGSTLYQGILFNRRDLPPEQSNCMSEGGQLYWSTTGYPWS
ncbi:hypothetical protein BGP78_05800 [Pseudoalteromonas sp. MSK9-3]|uniref:hypothetical protein n=1 Tax=Pseudoalteromonas sp. MSK9-3 TaxID=1897633 RepID=UPI000E6CDC33|nr:hypothetical protein [Pseudoalteromonas sp. MSK9-3]RJE78203.1 hypothetical protein BGP78_05800 [Pseudoalteromonas sp. MSK9-3]